MGKAEAIRAGVAVVNALLTVTFAPECAACASPLAAPLDGCICDCCWSSIEPAPHVEWPAGPLVKALAAGEYIGSLRQIIHAFKYDGRRSLARPLADLMRASGHDVLDGADCIVPVPLHPWRRMRRGFNQAADLAQALGLPVRPLLWRVRATTPQADLSAADRQRNVRRAFRVSPLVPAGTRGDIRGQVVVLVDDVRTTGATLHACAEVLATAGASEIRALTVAVRGQDSVAGDIGSDRGRAGQGAPNPGKPPPPE
jgi:ComF family protein